MGTTHDHNQTTLRSLVVADEPDRPLWPLLDTFLEILLKAINSVNRIKNFKAESQKHV
jgi:hypothetical protein